MEIYTSYFAVAPKIDKEKYLMISISRITPKWWKGIEFKDLAPNSDLLRRFKNGEVSEKDYKIEYLIDLVSELAKLDSLVNAKSDKDLVLLCYESPEKFCHRHLLAEFIKFNYGIEVKELEVK